MLVMVMSPVFSTVAVKSSRPPGATALMGQAMAIARPGVGTNGQLIELVSRTCVPAHRSAPDAMRVEVALQALVGAVWVPEKFADPPGLRLGKVKTIVLGAG